jgi:hypothetical protein
MAIVAQHATDTADVDGDAIFSFPDVPQGQLWCGTTQVPGAPSTMNATVTAGGLLVGSMQGPGSFGPWTCDYSQKLIISAAGLSPGAQYQAVWHADDKGSAFSTYPAPITTTVSGPVSVPVPLQVTGTVIADQGAPPWAVDGTVSVGNFPASQTVNGTVTAAAQLAGTAPVGALTMTGSPVQLPNLGATQGVTLCAPVANTHPVAIGGPAVTATTGFVLDPGHITPLLPVVNADLLYAIGTGPDVLTLVVT